MAKIADKTTFKKDILPNMTAGETAIVQNLSWSEVKALRVYLCDYVKSKNPDGIARFGTNATGNEFGEFEIEITALA